MRKGGGFLLDPVLGPVFTREQFSDEQREIDSMVRQFAKDRIKPVKDELEKHDGELMIQLMKEVAELGLTGIDVPEKYGGLELDKTTSALVAEALTLGESADFVVTFSCHVGIGSLPIVYFGTEEQKERYLPSSVTAEKLGAYALTEAVSGSDALGMKTTARLSEDESHYILNGNKIYITNGSWADVFTVFAKIDDKDVTAFIVDRDTPGFSTGAEEHKMGIKGSSTTSVYLDNVRIPKENLLGTQGKGHLIAFNILNVGRFKLGAADLGGCKSVVNVATQYALERKQFGQPIALFDAIRKKFADMVARTYALDSVIYRTVGLMDERVADLDSKDPGYPGKVMDALEEYAIEASISKIYGSETLGRVADHGVQIYGGNGFSEEYPMASIYRNCRIDRIYEGTSEINRMVIYGYYLKKALMEELPVRDAASAWAEPSGKPDGPLAWELRTLDVARGLSVKALFEAISRYGQDLRNEQIVGEDIADLIIGYFAASGAINRILQIGEKATSDRTYRALARLVVATYLEDVWRIMYRLRPVLFADQYAQNYVAELERKLQELHLPFDPVREVRVLTDDLFLHGHYRFE